jgi:hypothetical protein
MRDEKVRLSARSHSTPVDATVDVQRVRDRLGVLVLKYPTLASKPSKTSDIAVAIRYALGRCTPLLRYCDDAALDIDNAAERALRAVALGPNNYLFAGSNAGGERVAAIYTLIGSGETERYRSGNLYLVRALTHCQSSHHAHRRTFALKR